MPGISRHCGRLLFSLAYRMVGSVSEAEDIVQEAFLREQRALAQGAEIDSSKAYLSAVVTRLCIDHLRSARARREVYVGEWLPEPLLTDDDAELDPAIHAEQADSLSLAFLVLLEQLNPVERAVFLLHDVFGYGYDEIARTVDKSEANCRQLATRARRHIDEQKPRFEASRRERERLAAPLLRRGLRRRRRVACRAARGGRRRLRRRRRQGPSWPQPDLRPRSRHPPVRRLRPAARGLPA